MKIESNLNKKMFKHARGRPKRSALGERSMVRWTFGIYIKPLSQVKHFLQVL